METHFKKGSLVRGFLGEADCIDKELSEEGLRQDTHHLSHTSNHGGGNRGCIE